MPGGLAGSRAATEPTVELVAMVLLSIDRSVISDEEEEVEDILSIFKFGVSYGNYEF